jgi:hypothetical protein
MGANKRTCQVVEMFVTQAGQLYFTSPNYLHFSFYYPYLENVSSPSRVWSFRRCRCYLLTYTIH